MPNRWAIQNGNWSNTATWSGSLIPTSADDVFSNNFTVDIDTSFQVLTLRSVASASAVVAGGSFRFNTAGVSGSVTDPDPLRPGATNLIQVTATSGSVTLSLGGNATPRATNNDVLILHSGNCNFNISGNSFIGGTGGTTVTTISKTSAGLITITGTLNGGNGSTTGQALVSTNGNTTVVGSVVGGVTNTGNRAINQSAGILTITGSITGGQTATSNQGILFSGTRLLVSGTLTGGLVAAALETSAPLNILNGNIVAGLSPAVTSTSVSQINVSGSITAAATSHAISSTSAGSVVVLNGNMFNDTGRQAIYCQNLFLSETGTTQARFFTEGLQDRTLFSANLFGNLPSASNVRFGVTYGPGNELTGSLIMPDRTNVRYGVPTDNTTGSALLDAQSLFTEIATSTNPVAVRLRTASTVNTVGTLLTAFKK